MLIPSPPNPGLLTYLQQRWSGLDVSKDRVSRIDMQRGILTAQGIRLVGMSIASGIVQAERRGISVQAVGGIGEEAIPLVTAAITCGHDLRELHMNLPFTLEGFWVSHRQLVGCCNSPDYVALVVPLVTDGAQVLEALPVIAEAGARVALLIALLHAGSTPDPFIDYNIPYLPLLQEKDLSPAYERYE